MARQTDPAEAQRLMDELSDLTLPLMWQLRQDALRAFEDLNIRPVAALLLELIAQGLHHPKDLSDVLDTVPPTISAMLRDLEGRGLVARETDPNDRRRVRLELTRAGEALRGDMQRAWRQMGQHRYAALSAGELRSLLQALHKLFSEHPE